MPAWNVRTTVLISDEEFEYVQTAMLSCSCDGSITIGIWIAMLKQIPSGPRVAAEISYFTGKVLTQLLLTHAYYFM